MAIVSKSQLIPHREYLSLKQLIATYYRDGSLSEPDLGILRSIVASLVSPEKVALAMEAALKRMGPPPPGSILGIVLGIEQGQRHA